MHCGFGFNMIACHFLTKLSAISVPENPPISKFYEVQNCRLTDIETCEIFGRVFFDALAVTAEGLKLRGNNFTELGLIA